MNTEESVYRVVNTVVESAAHSFFEESHVHTILIGCPPALFFQDWARLQLVAPFLRVFMDGLRTLERRTATIWR